MRFSLAVPVRLAKTVQVRDQSAAPCLESVVFGLHLPAAYISVYPIAACTFFDFTWPMGTLYTATHHT
jgi:hypothetical protein